jgi:hypothetical protein
VRHRILGALADEIPLHLGQAGQRPQHKATYGGLRVKTLLDGVQSDTGLLESLHKIEHIAGTAAYAVPLVANHSINLTRCDHHQQPLHPRAIEVLGTVAVITNHLGQR